MSQTTSRRIRDQISLLRSQARLPFSDLLDAQIVKEVLEGGRGPLPGPDLARYVELNPVRTAIDQHTEPMPKE